MTQEAFELHLSNRSPQTFEPGDQVPLDWLFDAPTIDALFEVIAQALENSAEVEVGYHAEYGYPEAVFIDSRKGIVDDEEYLELTSFSPHGA